MIKGKTIGRTSNREGTQINHYSLGLQAAISRPIRYRTDRMAHKPRTPRAGARKAQYSEENRPYQWSQWHQYNYYQQHQNPYPSYLNSNPHLRGWNTRPSGSKRPPKIAKIGRPSNLPMPFKSRTNAKRYNRNQPCPNRQRPSASPKQKQEKIITKIKEGEEARKASLCPQSRDREEAFVT